MIPEVTIHIGLLTVQLFMGECHSLKEKRKILRRLKDQVRNKFNVSIAELDQQDKWQVAVVGFVMIGGDQRYIEKILQHLLNFIDGYHAVEISEQSIEFF